jgi:hypothetical protein
MHGEETNHSTTESKDARAQHGEQEAGGAEVQLKSKFATKGTFRNLAKKSSNEGGDQNEVTEKHPWSNLRVLLMELFIFPSYICEN